MPKRLIEPVEEDEEDEEMFEEDEVKPKKKMIEPRVEKEAVKTKEIKRRFGIIPPQNIKVIDTESQEVLGDGDFAVIQVLTDILERLERIETSIGRIAQ